MEDHVSDLTPDDEALISAARGGLEATPEDRARVKGKLFAQIGIATGIAGSAISTSTAASAGAAAGASAGAAAGAATGAAATTGVLAGVSLTTKLVLAAIVISGAGGAIAIHENAKKTNASTMPSPPAVMMPASPVSTQNVAPTSQPEIAPAVTGPTTTATPAIDQAATPPPAIVNPPVSPAQVATPKSNAVSARDHVASNDSTSTSSPTTTATPQVTAVASGPTTVDAEAAILRNADAALKRGDAQGALALVDQHARQFPNGILAEERDAERVVVLCALGRTDEARAAGAAFLRAHPRSPQTSRIRASCAGN